MTPPAPPATPPLTGQVTAPPPLLDVPGTKRLAGGDRYETAAAVARDSFPAGPVPVVYVTTGEQAADALAAGPAADVQGGPVLLVGRDAVPATTRAELTRLQPQRIVVLGGTAAVSEDVVASLQAASTGIVTRLAGADRYATAALVATSAFPTPVARVHLATGTGSTDALAAAAAGAHTDGPVLLTTRDGLPASTAAALTSLRPRDITVVGGPAAVSDAVLAQLSAYAVGGAVVRAAGADRFATAARLAELVWPGPTPVVYLATGRAPWDALTGVPAAGRDSAPVLLVEPTCMPAATRRQLDRLQPTTVVVLGGTSAVSARAVERRRPAEAGARRRGEPRRRDRSAEADVVDEEARRVRRVVRRDEAHRDRLPGPRREARALGQPDAARRRCSTGSRSVPSSAPPVLWTAGVQQVVRPRARRLGRGELPRAATASRRRSGPSRSARPARSRRCSRRARPTSCRTAPDRSC